MSENLGNVPRQVKMTEEQEQTFTNGINKGRKLERKRIKANILSRVDDLKACGKDDNCHELAKLIKSWLPEWLDEESN